jgi:hypothetical protein
MDRELQYFFASAETEFAWLGNEYGFLAVWRFQGGRIATAARIDFVGEHDDVRPNRS